MTDSKPLNDAYVEITGLETRVSYLRARVDELEGELAIALALLDESDQPNG